MKASIKILILFILITIGAVVHFMKTTSETTINDIVINNIHTDFIKSKSDNNQYQYQVLPNGLSVLLISDPSLEKAAAAMRVFAGFSDTPKQAMGLPHFTEHMLFLGNEKYPKPDTYQNFVLQHGGSSNAFTNQNYTVYYFDILSEHLEHTLDMFSGFFTTPLFLAEYLDKEKHAVDAEFNMNIKSDGWRFNSVQRATTNPEHPYSYFDCGNLLTLTVDDNTTLREQVIEYYNKFYHANNMVLTMVGPQELSELSLMATKYFGDIKNSGPTDFTKRSYDQMPIFRAEDVKKQFNIKSEADTFYLSVDFPIDNMSDKYLTAPHVYIYNLLTQKHGGSLYNTLLSDGMINNMGAYVEYLSDNTNTFKIYFDLTRIGYDNYKLVVEKLFAYLNLLKKSGIAKWRFQEMQQIAQLKFDYQPAVEPIVLARDSLEKFAYVKLADLLTADNLLFEYSENDINQLFQQLSADNMRITLASKNEQTDQQEQYYQTPYRVTDLDNNWLQELDNITDEHFVLSTQNEYITKNIASTVDVTPQAPKLVASGDGYRAWHLPDYHFKLPQLSVVNLVFSNHLNSSAKNYILTEIFVDSLNQFIGEKYASAIEAANNIYVSSYGDYLSIKLQGYDQNILLKLLQQLNFDLINFQPSKERFLAILDDIKREYENNKVLPPFRYIFAEATNEFDSRVWTAKEQALIVNEIDYDDMQVFVDNFNNNLGLETFVYGGSSEVLMPLINTARAGYNLQAEFSFLYHDPMLLATDMSEGIQVTTKHNDIAVLDLFFASQRNTADIAKVLLLSSILSNPFYNDLRTEKQLGYVVHGGSFGVVDKLGMLFLVQSSKEKAQLLSESMDNFYSNISLQVLESLAEQEFNTYKKSLIANLLKKPVNSKEVINKILAEIAVHRYWFDKYQQVAEAVSQLSKDELLSFMRENLLRENKLTVKSVK